MTVVHSIVPLTTSGQLLTASNEYLAPGNQFLFSSNQLLDADLRVIITDESEFGNKPEPGLPTHVVPHYTWCGGAFITSKAIIKESDYKLLTCNFRGNNYEFTPAMHPVALLLWVLWS